MVDKSVKVFALLQEKEKKKQTKEKKKGKRGNNYVQAGKGDKANGN